MDSLPSPLGEYPVGVSEFDFIDENRSESFNPGKKRRLLVRVWYPAHADTGESASYACLSEELRSQLRQFGVVGSISGSRMAELMNDYVLRFFDRYVRGEQDAFDAQRFLGRYPEAKPVDLGDVRDWARTLTGQVSCND